MLMRCDPASGERVRVDRHLAHGVQMHKLLSPQSLRFTRGHIADVLQDHLRDRLLGDAVTLGDFRLRKLLEAKLKPLAVPLRSGDRLRRRSEPLRPNPAIFSPPLHNRIGTTNSYLNTDRKSSERPASVRGFHGFSETPWLSDGVKRMEC